MLHFYGVLALNQYERNYHFFQNEIKEQRSPKDITYQDKIWTVDFNGTFIQKEEGAQLLTDKQKDFQNDREYLIALYSLVAENIKDYISEDSFLLLDNGKEVFIYNATPLYCSRREDGEIYISSDSKSFLGKHFSILKEHSSLLFYNNNLKTL